MPFNWEWGILKLFFYNCDLLVWLGSHTYVLETQLFLYHLYLLFFPLLDFQAFVWKCQAVSRWRACSLSGHNFKGEPRMPLLWSRFKVRKLEEKMKKKPKNPSWKLSMFVCSVSPCTCLWFQALSHQTYMGEDQILRSSKCFFGGPEERKEKCLPPSWRW